MEALLLYSTAVWFIFYMINHSELLQKVRAALFPALPKWLATLLACPICFCWWFTAALSFFWFGFTPMILTAPVVTLFLDLAYLRLKTPDRPPSP